MTEGIIECGLASGFEFGNGTGQKFVVEGKADCLDLTALALTEQFAGTTDFEIMSRQGEARAECFE